MNQRWVQGSSVEAIDAECCMLPGLHLHVIILVTMHGPQQCFLTELWGEVAALCLKVSPWQYEPHDVFDGRYRLHLLNVFHVAQLINPLLRDTNHVRLLKESGLSVVVLHDLVNGLAADGDL